jgi:hypothetical protein
VAAQLAASQEVLTSMSETWIILHIRGITHQLSAYATTLLETQIHCISKVLTKSLTHITEVQQPMDA